MRPLEKGGVFSSAHPLPIKGCKRVTTSNNKTKRKDKYYDHY